MNETTEPLVRPELHMPAAEAKALRAAYDAAETILEYGAGGSTLIAADLPGRTVFSVESDLAWIAHLQACLAARPPVATVRLHHGDIGPTTDWGRPAQRMTYLQWPDYPLTVWDRPDFRHPDVVLIDGRFRVACFLATAMRITRPVTVLFDDYARRPVYHELAAFCAPTGMIGRMACFNLDPQPFPTDRIGWFIRSFMQPA